MATTTLTKENFKETLEKGGTVFIDFWAAWCGPCRNFAPIYEKASEKHAGITFAKVNTEEQPELAGMFQIESIPTIMVFREKVLLFAQPGALLGDALDEIAEQIQKLDMDDVRKKIAEAEEKEKAGEKGA